MKKKKRIKQKKNLTLKQMVERFIWPNEKWQKENIPKLLKYVGKILVNKEE